MEPTNPTYDIDSTVLLLSLVITWTIGLLPPLIARFLIYRKPFSKAAAIVFCAIFWILNVVIFTALGSKSKTHTALILVALASYYILKIGSKSDKGQPALEGSKKDEIADTATDLKEDGGKLNISSTIGSKESEKIITMKKRFRVNSKKDVNKYSVLLAIIIFSISYIFILLVDGMKNLNWEAATFISFYFFLPHC